MKRTLRLHTRFLLPAFCLLAACGFQPIYGAQDKTGTPVAGQLNQIAIDNIPERSGQILRNELIDRMYGQGRPRQPLYRLEVKLRATQEDLGLRANATSTRTLLNMNADYILRATQGKELLRGTAHSITNFNRLSTQYGNVSALDAATERTLREVSEQIVNRLALYFAETATAN
ncbi:MAG: LPS assembly lipoprotein LptE [Alphaproteobacteria bacterium]|nr:LPS assembly lipoprotein LptE [Alphaproteobacteria bacterium]